VRVLAAGRQGSNKSTSSSGNSSSSNDCGPVKAHDGPPTGTLSPSSSSSSSPRTVQVTAGGTQPPRNPAATSSSSSLAPPKYGLQPGDIVVRGGDDGSWRCIKRPGCKPSALAFGVAFRPLRAAGECQQMGGCEAVKQQGACNAPFSWEVDRRAAAVVQYCGEQCKCPGESQ
jgi:hypothetical protein